MTSLGMLVIQVPAAAFALALFVYGHFADRALSTGRIRDFLISMAALILGSLAVIAVVLFTHGVFGRFL